MSILDTPIARLDGSAATLGEITGGAPALLVNVASKCGLTPQYTGLEALHEEYAARGFTVVGLPCNQFGGQEPGTAAEIAQFCKSTYDVSFPMFEKLEVKGANQHPLYKTMLAADSPAAGEIKWNFEKILVGRDGKVIKRFASGVKPDDKDLGEALTTALARK